MGAGKEKMPSKSYGSELIDFSAGQQN